MLTHSLLLYTFREHSFIVLTRRKNTRLNASKSLFPLFNKFYQNISIFREEPTLALPGFHAGSQSWWNWNLEMLVFVENRRTWRKTLSAVREPTTNSTHSDSRAESNAGHIGGRRALLSLCHA